MSTRSSHQSLKRIAVALSGGIDSSVTAHLLSQLPNVDLMALHMSNWNAADEENGGGGDHSSNSRHGRTGSSGGNTYCQQSEKDANDAQSIADHLKIRMTRVEFQSEYWHGVFEPFLEGLDNCRMINPDVGCNSIVKFGAMRKYAMDQLDADYVATGHYARLWHRDRNRNRNRVLSHLDEIQDAMWNISSSTRFASAQSILPRVVEDALNDYPEDAWIEDWGMKDDDDDDNENKMPTSPLLLAGADITKDQSYFLCGVHARNFSNVLFPLGNLHKNTLKASSKLHGDNINNTGNGDGDDYTHTQTQTHTVRELASMAFPSNVVDAHNKKESMGICFIGKRNFADFIAEYLPNDAIPGDFVDVDTGKVVGQHRGAAFYTIGQGAKISGASCKWFTAQKDRTNGTVYVCNDTHHPSLYSDELYVAKKEFHWINGEEPPQLKEGGELMAFCRTRHLQPLIPCTISRRRQGEETFWTVKFDRPVRGITPGQTAAIYVTGGLICLGGGQISHPGPTFHEMGKTLPSQLHPAGANDLSVRR